MKRGYKAYSTWLRPETILRLREVSRRYRVPASVILREVLDRALDLWEADHATRNWLDPCD